MSPPVLSPRRGLVPAALACLAALAVGGPARADTVNFVSDPSQNGLGSFTGSLAVANTTVGGSVQSTLTFTLNNTTGGSTGGPITGFAFNDPTPGVGGRINAVTLSSVIEKSGATATDRTGSYQVFGGTGFYNGVPGSPYGKFDVGVGNGSTLQNGNGGASSAIDAGRSGVFTMTVKWDAGSNANPTAGDFLAATSTGGSQAGVGLVVRFQNFYIGCSTQTDTVPFTTWPPPPPKNVPAPPGVLLGLIGLGGCVFGRAFRRRAVAATV